VSLLFHLDGEGHKQAQLRDNLPDRESRIERGEHRGKTWRDGKIRLDLVNELDSKLWSVVVERGGGG
jgi:hypothetical protein